MLSATVFSYQPHKQRSKSAGGGIMANSKGQSGLTAIDLFSGCGGLTSGLEEAGFRVIAAIEKDRDAADTYSANHRSVRLYRKDIRKVSTTSILSDLDLEPGRLDLIAGCPPCQGFTRLTETKMRRDPRNALVRDFLGFVKELMPRACMLENV
ncbi:MAG TPA: DNA cytosine methyltransferase, partial [Thermoanaerobaculia bacterium]|nr:DNA cytosine methyltransferase [Thermoanaerobaculia bacterium]